MKRYLLFSGSYYYPDGGWDDCRGFFDTIEECEKAVVGDWYQIVDTRTWKVCCSRLHGVERPHC